MVAPYDGCFVTREVGQLTRSSCFSLHVNTTTCAFICWFQEDNYVLSMLWLGLPVRMSCPQVRPCSSNPPVVACYAEGMVVKMDWPLSDIKVNGKIKRVLSGWGSSVEGDLSV